MAKTGFSDILSRMEGHIKSLEVLSQRLDAHNANLEQTASVLTQKLDAIEGKVGELNIAAGPAQPVVQPGVGPVGPATAAQILNAPTARQ
jgi:hypothetical protein